MRKREAGRRSSGCKRVQEGKPEGEQWGNMRRGGAIGQFRQLGRAVQAVQAGRVERVGQRGKWSRRVQEEKRRQARGGKDGVT